MKRLALLLGSLLVVSAAASAKEVVPAPVVVEEAPVQIVEKEVIVYRDKEMGWRPSGYVDLQYRYYGKTEKKQADDGWNENNKYSRAQLQTKINFTENQTLEARGRYYNSLEDSNKRRDGKTDELRLRYFYNHGMLGDSKVNLTSRVEYKDKARKQSLQYEARFDFAEYLFNNDFIKTDEFVLAPRYTYTWASSNNDSYKQEVGLEFNSSYTLPLGFSAEFNVYADYQFLNGDNEISTRDGHGKVKMEDRNMHVELEAYLYHNLPLYKGEKLTVTLHNEGGYDPYSWDQHAKYKMTKDEKVLWKRADGTEIKSPAEWKEDDDRSYEVYLLSTIEADYQATEFLNLYAAVGAEYRNWAVTSENSAKDWRWQPTAWAGFRATF